MKRKILLTVSIITTTLLLTGILTMVFYDNRLIVREFSVDEPHNGDMDFGYIVSDILRNDPSQFDDDESGADKYKVKLEEAGYEFTEDNMLLLGRTSTARDARRKAEEIWVALYGEDIKWDYKPYIIWYDVSYEVWFVEGSLRGRWIHKVIDTFTTWFGGAPYILIRKEDGKVLGVWHTK